MVLALVAGSRKKVICPGQAAERRLSGMPRWLLSSSVRLKDTQPPTRTHTQQAALQQTNPNLCPLPHLSREGVPAPQAIFRALSLLTPPQNVAVPPHPPPPLGGGGVSAAGEKNGLFWVLHPFLSFIYCIFSRNTRIHILASPTQPLAGGGVSAAGDFCGLFCGLPPLRMELALLLQKH